MKTKEVIKELEKMNLQTEVCGDYLNIIHCKGGTVAYINLNTRFEINTGYWAFKNLLAEDEKEKVYVLLTKLAETDPEDREDEKRFIIPLPGLVTTDGKQQYLSHKGNFFASRRDEELRQTWKEEHLKFVPEVYRQFAVEFDEEKEY